MKKEILGIKIDDITIDEIIKTVQGWLSKSGRRPFDGTQDHRHYIVTPNPEIVVMAQKDRELKDIINKADLAIADGVGLKLSGNIKSITPGTDILAGLVKMASVWGFTTGFLGGREDVAEKAAERLLRKYPKLKVVFAGPGGEVSKDGTLLKSLKLAKCDLLFVAFGPPKQEKWIYKNLDKLDVKVAMGVGGAFDYLSGQIPRAPRWIRNLGFEWLFRLAVQPWRIKRQLALVKYLFYVKLKLW